MNKEQTSAIRIIRQTECWLEKHEPDIYYDNTNDIIKQIIGDIERGHDPEGCLMDFEDWIEDLLRML